MTRMLSIQYVHRLTLSQNMYRRMETLQPPPSGLTRRASLDLWSTFVSLISCLSTLSIDRAQHRGRPLVSHCGPSYPPGYLDSRDPPFCSPRAAPDFRPGAPLRPRCRSRLRPSRTLPGGPRIKPGYEPPGSSSASPRSTAGCYDLSQRSPAPCRKLYRRSAHSATPRHYRG